MYLYFYFECRAYAGELHFVHYNTRHGKDKAEAEPDGLAVFCIFIEIGDEHPEFKKITDCMPEIQAANSKTHLKQQLDPSKLLPDGMETYLTYHGSLTTPPNSEVVTFLVLDNKTIKISEEQLNAMRSLSDGDEDCGCITHNFRPTFKQGNRLVRRNKCAASSTRLQAGANKSRSNSRDTTYSSSSDNDDE